MTDEEMKRFEDHVMKVMHVVGAMSVEEASFLFLYLAAKLDLFANIDEQTFVEQAREMFRGAAKPTVKTMN